MEVCQMKKIKSVGRPRIERSVQLVAKTFRLHPDTCEKLRDMADREGLSQARVIDHLVRLNEVEVKVVRRP